MTGFMFLLEILGTVAFAISGVMVARDQKMDIFGAVVLGCVTAVGGGIIRDLILGSTPPAMFQNPVYVATAAVTSLLIFALDAIGGSRRERLRDKAGKALSAGGLHVDARTADLALMIADTAGLAAFVAVGTRTAFEGGYADNVFLCVFVGTVTGVGGGIIRDMMAGQTPLILRKHVYGLAAILGAIAYCLVSRLGLGYIVDSVASMAVTCLIRYLAIRYRWNLPAFH